MIIDTTPGMTYAVTSPNGCTVTQHVGEATIVHDVPAGVQVLIIAHASKFEIDDDSAIVTECGGSAELVFTAATTRAASSGSGSDGMTAEERALLNGAAQRDADNTFSAANTFTGSVDMSGAQVTPPEGWNVEGGAELTVEAIQATAPLKWGEGVNATGEATAPLSLTFGSAFTDTAGSYTCTTEGTGSITIGAGANTLNNGTTESSNSVTIGFKASNTGSDSVVLGAQAKLNDGAGGVVIGAGASSVGRYVNNVLYAATNSITIGSNATNNSTGAIAIGQNSKGGLDWSIVIGADARCSHVRGVSIGSSSYSSRECVALGAATVSEGQFSICGGYGAKTNAYYAIAFGCTSEAKGINSVAIGKGAKAADYGAVVFRSTAEDGTYTQLYFSGANTPLANTYEGGEAMMGYVVRDSAGNIMTDAEGNAMVGTQKLSVLFPNNRGENAFTPAMLGLDDEWTPKPMFRPSDLDLPDIEIEEPTEAEEYTPLPVYPIVEPEIPEMEEV